MKIQKPAFILTDIEGTTSSISFVTDVLFPYFRARISDLLLLKDQQVVTDAFAETIRLAKEIDREDLFTDEQIIGKLFYWCVEDRKITPLKTLQGVIWKIGYEQGKLEGHVYPEVATVLNKWKTEGIDLGVFSSGSIAAQKLIFGYSISGDLTAYFSNYFDTTTGGKREIETYTKIANSLQLDPNTVLFLSDIEDELRAADTAGFQTVQLCREQQVGTWKNQVRTFLEIEFIDEL